MNQSEFHYVDGISVNFDKESGLFRVILECMNDRFFIVSSSTSLAHRLSLDVLKMIKDFERDNGFVLPVLLAEKPQTPPAEKPPAEKPQTPPAEKPPTEKQKKYLSFSVTRGYAVNCKLDGSLNVELFSLDSSMLKFKMTMIMAKTLSGMILRYPLE